MKNPKNLKSWMKKLINDKGLYPSNYQYIKNTSIETIFIHRYGTKPIIYNKIERSLEHGK